MAGELLVVGRVQRAHGIRGEVLVRTETDRAERVFAPGRAVVIGGPRGERGSATIAAMRPHKGGLLLRLEGVETRNAAETLAGRDLLLPAEEVEPLEEGEVFIHDLIGVDVFDAGGQRIGTVRQVYVSEPADLLEVRTPERDVLIPFTERIVREIDVEARRLVVEPPPGLLDL